MCYVMCGGLKPAHHGVAVAVEGAVTQQLAQHAGAFQKQANLQLVGHADAAVQLRGFVEHFFGQI